MLAFAVVLAVGVAGGGFFPRTWRIATTALLCLTAAALLLRPRAAIGRREAVAVAGLFGLAGWTYMSARWSPLPAGSRVEAERALLYAVALLNVLVGVSKRDITALLAGLTAGITGVAAYALARLVLSPPPPDPFQGANLHEPFGYANALGVFVVLGIVASVGLALAAHRAVALAPLGLLVPTLWLTSSRGAWIALPVGIVVTLGAGRVVRLRAVGAVLVIGVAVAFALGSERGQPLSPFGENRPHYWRVAVQAVGDHPTVGYGAGTYGAYWLEHRPVDEFVHDAHSLPLETLAELGPPGLLLLAVALGLPLVALARRLDRPTAAAAGAYAAFVFHASADWDWEFAAVGLVGVACAGAVLVGSRTQGDTDLGRARTPLMLAALAAAVLVAVRLGT